MPHIERDAELHVFRAIGPGLLERGEHDVETPVRHAELRQQNVDGPGQLLRRRGAHLRQPSGFRTEACARLRFPRSQFREIEPRRVDQIQLCARRSSRFDDVVETRPIFLEESEQAVPVLPHLVETRRVEVDGGGVVVDAARELLERVEPGVEQLLHPRRRWVDALDGRERALSGSELRQHARVFRGEKLA